MRAAVQTVEDAEGAVGVLVNNAGYSQGGPIEQVPMEAVRRQFETNVFGAIRLAQLVLAGMRGQRWGKIVNVGSMGGRVTFPGGGLYHATKYSLEAISDALRFEVRGFGIDAILIEPGLITSDFAQAAVASTATLDEEREHDRWRLRAVQREGRRAHDRRLRGPDAPPRRRPGRRGEGDREGDLTPPRAGARARDALGAAHGAPAPSAPGPRVGRGDASAVPAAAVARRARGAASRRAVTAATRRLRLQRSAGAGAPDVKPLRVVDAERPQQLQRGLVADELGDRLAPHAARDVDDRADDERVVARGRAARARSRRRSSGS